MSLINSTLSFFLFFFFNDTATTEIYTLSLHDALPISAGYTATFLPHPAAIGTPAGTITLEYDAARQDRKSTRLNSSHLGISYAVFCLKKKKKKKKNHNHSQHHVVHSLQINDASVRLTN